MTSWFSSLNPIPSFSNFTGPYTVGTLDVEIPVAELSSPAPAPDPSISTVNFRVFYPCELSSPPAKATQKPLHWLPDPQREYFRAYLRFSGGSARLAGVLQYLPFFNIISRVTIPAVQNAQLLPPTTRSGRWPVMVFSHGLGGSRNAYSQISGAMASHGIVVVATDHRDGSAPISFIRSSGGFDSKAVEYRTIPHVQGQDVEDGRNAQLRIRLWELGLIHDALLRTDRGEALTNLATQGNATLRNPDLAIFAKSLDVHTPGRISWAGHSFGAATMIQFLKSVFHSNPPSPPTTYKPLFTPAKSSPITSQITSSTPLILFDLWALPLRSAATDWLWQQPLPCYSPSHQQQAQPNLLAILSESFFKWKTNLTLTKTVLYPSNPTTTTTTNPHVFYPLASSHTSQSDFGVLSPWLAHKLVRAHDPLRTLRLNALAALELLRRSGLEIATPSPLDMVAIPQTRPNPHDGAIILSPDGNIPGWVPLGPDAVFEHVVDQAEGDYKAPADAVLEGEVLGG